MSGTARVLDRGAYKTIRFIDRATDYVLLLLFLLLFLIGAYTMYDTLLIYDAARGDDLRSFKPYFNEKGELVWNMDGLTEDVVAWLTIDDTNIDYPVMQGKDNFEYLNKSPFGKYSLSGSLYVDVRNAPDFSDPYSLIYGHHMQYGQMFGALDAFLNEDYFRTHRTGTLIVKTGKVYKIKLFASVEADASNRAIFAPNETSGPLAYVKAHASVYYTPEGEHLIGLSTCKLAQTSDRIIVFGVLEE